MLRQLLIALALMAVCLVIHVTGLLLVGDRLVRWRQKIEAQTSFVHSAFLLILVFSAVILLHLIEAVIWASFFNLNGLFKDFETSLYFSLKSYSTVGYGDTLLPQDWRLLGGIEALSGVLFCGLSAAFLFAIVNAMFRFRVKRVLRQHLHRTEDPLRTLP